MQYVQGQWWCARCYPPQQQAIDPQQPAQQPATHPQQPIPVHQVSQQQPIPVQQVSQQQPGPAPQAHAGWAQNIAGPAAAVATPAGGLGPQTASFILVGGSVMTILCLLLGVPITIAFMVSLVNDGYESMVQILLGPALVLAGVTTFFVSPRRIRVHQGGFLVSRGFGGKTIFWSQVHAIVYGSDPQLGLTNSGKHGVHVLTGHRTGITVLSGNNGRGRTRRIADAMMAVARLPVQQDARGNLRASRL